MKRLGLIALLASGCAEGADGSSPSPGSLGPGNSATGEPTSADPMVMEQPTTATSDASTTDDSGEADTSSSTSSSTGDPATGSSGSGGSSSESGLPQTSGTPLEVCEPHGTDSICFACGRTNCCNEILECYDDTVCTCSLDCIEAGGRAQMCNDMCGGLNAPSLGITACIRQNCDAQCDGI